MSFDTSFFTGILKDIKERDSGFESIFDFFRSPSKVLENSLFSEMFKPGEERTPQYSLGESSFFSQQQQQQPPKQEAPKKQEPEKKVQPPETESKPVTIPYRTVLLWDLPDDKNNKKFLLEALSKYGELRSLEYNSELGGWIASFFDIRNAKDMMKSLKYRNFALDGGCKVNARYIKPPNFLKEQEYNQGILVVFNLSSSVTNDELEKAFSKFGEIRGIRCTPNKSFHRFVEFFDVRDAQMVMEESSKNGISLGYKPLKIEVSDMFKGGKAQRK